MGVRQIEQGKEPSVVIQPLSQEWMRHQWQLELHHADTAHRIIWITKGQGTASVNCMGRGFSVHNLFYIPAHSLFSMRILGGCTGFVVTIPSHLTIRHPKHPIHLRLKSAQDQQNITGLIERINTELTTPKLSADVMVQAHCQILNTTIERLYQTHKDHIRVTRTTHLFERFSTLLSLEYQQLKTVADYAEYLHVTPTHLSRVCKASCGLPAASVINQRILHQARNLLEYSTNPIKEISTSLGFGSPAYFSRSVQKQFGQAPSDLRRQKRN